MFTVLDDLPKAESELLGLVGARDALDLRNVKLPTSLPCEIEFRVRVRTSEDREERLSCTNPLCQNSVMSYYEFRRKPE